VKQRRVGFVKTLDYVTMCLAYRKRLYFIMLKLWGVVSC